MSYMKKFIHNLLKSLDTTKGGFSFRKVLSLGIMGCIIFIHSKHTNDTNADSILMWDVIFICALLGLINLDRLIEAKFGGGGNSNVEQKDESTDPEIDNPDQTS